MHSARRELEWILGKAGRPGGPAEARPADGLAVDFVVESNRAQLRGIAQRVRDGRLRTNIGNVSTLDDAVAAFNRTERRKGKTIIRVRIEDARAPFSTAIVRQRGSAPRDHVAR